MEDPLDVVWIVDRSEQGARTATVGAGEHLDQEHAAEQLSPRIARSRPAVLLGGVRDRRLAVALQRVASERLLGGVRGWRTRSLRALPFAPLVIAATVVVVRQRRRRHDAIAHAGGGREHTVIRELHAPRPGHERAEPFEERQRIEDDVRGAVGNLRRLHLM